ncbi:MULTISPECIES: response regulator transcription factor [unclassified Saccharopolyspora]|uniref:response regulator transcription factor n=1 Tax=unclassified Saccharopolyspora TaxID=2646250 RepID=UPI001CD8023D|nr:MULTISPECIES: response regulator transcription factor [unclassified Saccharopolyspora]MCA1186978.1 response regulator transcription factor [Saccharopolyspora sp. 6T]MCA1192643.1 response regulator transcription factor [Saccharopolyspora sp. 6V]MCA1227743.1 response regulator transcription factor [Saccharopolyspora sp. 6M]MCA1281795.1 response regulator transcription factor [Saccharopolyspora sp. 7B]
MSWDVRGTTVLLVEDDEVIREATELALRRYGFEIRTAGDGLAGLAAFREREPDVVLLDVMLPELDGISLCRGIREESSVAILMLTARSDAVDVVQGLEAGADDYVTKPFDTMVLVARLRAALRRREPVRPAEDASAGDRLAFGDLELDRDSLEVRRGGRLLSLTPTELRLLLEFTGEPGRVLSRGRLLEQVWDYPASSDTRVVDVHVQRLRVKVGKERIETVRGFGYKLVG